MASLRDVLRVWEPASVRVGSLGASVSSLLSLRMPEKKERLAGSRLSMVVRETLLLRALDCLDASGSAV